jgi:hypothetical protein
VKVIALTGSREWTDRAAIEQALAGAELLLVGDCPTGADAIALQVAKEWDVIVRVFAADWDRLGKFAGPQRNEVLASHAAGERAYGMDVHCHAFPLGESRGTRDCIGRLLSKGLHVEVHNG